MAEPDVTEDEWEDGDSWETYEVNRHGDWVYYRVSKRDGTSYVQEICPEDALNIGLALAQAAQDPEEKE